MKTMHTFSKCLSAKGQNTKNIREARGSRISCEVAKQTIVAIIVLGLLFLPGFAAAGTERYVLKFDDIQLRGYQNDPAKLFLKVALRQQYPWVDPADLELKRVVFVGKSRHGYGRVQLRVGRHYSAPHVVDGYPEGFQRKNRRSFDRVAIKNPARGSRGPWQMDLKGNFRVRKVILEVRDDYPEPRWYGYSHSFRPYRHSHGDWR